MSNTRLGHIEQVSWQAVRDSVSAVNPELAEVIDRFKPDASYAIYKVRYPYGSHYFYNGELWIPNQHGIISPIHDASVAKHIQDELSYSTVPLTMWLNTSAEVYVEMDERIIPTHAFTLGSLAGLWEVLEPPESPFRKRIWNVAVGSRSSFMLPKITDNIGLNRLSKACGLKILASPKSIFEQHWLFTEIAHSQKLASPWYCEVLMFSKKWFEPNLDNNAWLRFQQYMLHKEWLQNIYWRNKATFDLIGQAFASAQSSKNLRPNTYLIDTVMCLISLGVSAVPGYAPVVQGDETAGPMQDLQKAFVDYYGLKNYVPTIFKPLHLGNQPGDSIYYSLQTPTVIASSPSNRTAHSVLEDVRMVKRLLEALQQKLAEDHPSIFRLIHDVEYTFFHSEPDDYYGVHSTFEIPEYDPRVLQNPYNKGRDFCDTGSFLRGCVKITRK